MKFFYKAVRRDNSSIFARGKYKLQFNKGTCVSAVPGTLGIMGFRTISECRSFIDNHICRGTGSKVIKLQPLEEIKIIQYRAQITSQLEETFDLFYRSLSQGIPSGGLQPCEGTVTCMKVNVMGEVWSPYNET